VRRALISDIHGNLEALDAVLADIAARDIDEIFCLGDMIGYGPNPRECIDRVMKNCRVSLLGNQEQGVLLDLARADDPNDRAVNGTREEPWYLGESVENEIRKAYLANLPRSHEHGPYLFVHGSPRNPLSEYVFPEDIHNRRKMEHLFQLVRHYCFQGHTHVPGIITETSEHFTPDEVNDQYDFGAPKLMVNIGSVGQPRDGDNRACYVILDDGPNEGVNSGEGKDGMPTRSPRITYRRIAYDFETTIGKIRAIS
jgi:diadenosine tetraphosphatase ApaH/serine/threonine PP2A family protein phosphatase